MIRVVVVDDQELVRSGFRLILERGGLDVVGEAADGIEAQEVVARTIPDVVLMDVRMPRLDGIEATRRIVADHPSIKILALTTFDLDEYVYSAVRAGASGFLLKHVSPSDLVHAVGVVARGDMVVSPALTRRLLDRYAAEPDPQTASSQLRDLSERETEVLRLVARGLANGTIAGRLFLSEATVKTYVSRLLTKLGVRDRVQLAVLAYETGLVRAGDSADRGGDQGLGRPTLTDRAGLADEAPGG
jgi:DNA-binding NarL/FixJ family response regulator